MLQAKSLSRVRFNLILKHSLLQLIKGKAMYSASTSLTMNQITQTTSVRHFFRRPDPSCFQSLPAHILYRYELIHHFGIME